MQSSYHYSQNLDSNRLRNILVLHPEMFCASELAELPAAPWPEPDTRGQQRGADIALSRPQQPLSLAWNTWGLLDFFAPSKIKEIHCIFYSMLLVVSDPNNPTCYDPDQDCDKEPYGRGPGVWDPVQVEILRSLLLVRAGHVGQVMAGHQVRGAVSCAHREDRGRRLGAAKPDPGNGGETREETQHSACLPHPPTGSRGRHETIDSVLRPKQSPPRSIWGPRIWTVNLLYCLLTWK